MGSSDSAIYDISGKEISTRKCMILLTPPSFQLTAFIESFPANFTYQFVSLGSMIRDEINKHTNYSKMILDNLAKEKKVNQRILEILLKSAALQGDFMIKFAPKDQQEIQTWKNFMNKITIKLIVILSEEVDQSIAKRATYQEKIKQYQNHIKIIKSKFSSIKMLEVNHNVDTISKIMKAIE